ncbi:hypothetical protein PV327_010309 [Microctonus hyperodae]|uniref:Uncharacterized protein n=1 Tax=Microctonus hyperodae TaxID=165561 RepID=A0AA39KUT2_MICHY|nr:hypothetical protein PV327_010309 [Microctonus hyperodae]
MYKLGLVVLGFVSVIIAAPVEQSSPVAILEESRDGPNPDGSYSWSFKSENGINAREEGSLVPSENNKEDGAMSVQGSYSYTGEDGSLIEVTYTAGENGFEPKGNHLPTSPPIPEEIVKALEYIAAHPEENDIDAPKR